MTASSPAPLVCFHVLADRNGKPGGLLFHAGTGPAADLLPLIADEGFAELASTVPCHFRADVDDAILVPLQEAGWKYLAAENLSQTDIGFDSKALGATVAWVAGNWCMAPPAKATGPQAASRALALQLVQRVAADADTHEIEALLRQDPTLSYQLLRLVNSLGMGAGRKVTSFSQAILILGRQQLRRWLNLMLFAARDGDLRSAMLLARVAARARALELLAKARGLDKTTQEQAFMTGMFSLLGILFGMSLDEVIKPLAISEAVQGALLRYEGELGELLQLVEASERLDTDALEAALTAQQISHEDYHAALVQSYNWMLGVIRESQGGANA